MLDGKLVATACPPGKSSIRALWRLVAGSGVRRIVQLCDAEECAAYLPESGELAAEIRAPVQVRQLHVPEKSRGGGWQLTTLELTDAQGKVRHVEHAACSAWRDGDVPPADAMSELLQLVEDVCEEDAPTLVHCRGGLGRTGVFVALCSLIRQTRQQLRRGEPPSASVSQTVLDLRKQRPGLVQTAQQHRFISDTLAAWIAERGGKRLGASDEFSVSTSATSGMPSSSEISI
jgi:protein tyrosine phosphatase